AFLDSSRLVWAGGTLIADEWITGWDAKAGKALRRAVLKWGDEGSPEAQAFSPGADLLVTWPMSLWNAATGRRLRKIGDRDVGAHLMVFSPSGKTLGTQEGKGGDWDDPVQLWEVASGKERLRLPEDRPIKCMAFSPAGRLLATGWHHHIRMTDLVSGKEIGRFVGHERNVACLAFSPDGRRLVSGSEDTTVLVWDMAAITKKARPQAATIQSKELESIWPALASDDASKAYQAIL